MNHLNIPVSTNCFEDLINNNQVYIDKTQFIVPLLAHRARSSFFLSRPHGFGKSLFTSTLEQVFLGKKELFEGLYIYDKIEWDKYPVVRLSLDKIDFANLGLEIALEDLAMKEEKSIDDIMDKIRNFCGFYSWNARDFVCNIIYTFFLFHG